MGADPAETDEPVDLPDHGAATLRSMRPDDAEALVRFHDHLSPATVRRRFFDFHRHLSAAEVARFTHVDGTNRVALVVSVEDDIIAVARYDRIGTSPMAEVAFVVADDYQHLGLGALLLDRLAVRARRAGISVFRADTLADNHPMLSVFGDSGFPMRSRVGAGVVEVSLDIRGA